MRETTAWSRLGTPIRVLVWLVLVATALAIYREAEGLVAHVFSVLLLFIFASIIAIVLTPIVDAVQRLPLFHKHRAPAVLLLYLLFLAPLVGLVLLVTPTLISQAKQLPALATAVQSQFNNWGLPINLSALQNGLANINIAAPLGVISGVIGTIASVILVVVISIYLLTEGRGVIASLRNLFPQRTRWFDFVVVAVGHTLQAYVRGQILMSLIIGVYTAVIMQLLGVHYALVLGVAAAILELVPIVGAVIAMVLATLVAFLQSPTLGIEAAVAGLFGHGLEAYVLGPRISGRATQLHPLIAMSALLVGAEVGGILGALFSVPTAAVANIILGAAYRSHQGDAALSTHSRGKIKAETLPRLGDEIAADEAESEKGKKAG